MPIERDKELPKGIAVRLNGGLGNQLFIYAAGREIAERLNCPLMIDLRNYTLRSSNTPRPYALEWLIPPQHLLPPRKLRPTDLLRERLQRRIPLFSPRNVFQELGFGYDERIESVTQGATLLGYFQSWRYFTSIEDWLRNEFMGCAPTSPWGRQEARILRELGPWIGVHVRRGDYLRPDVTVHHGLLGTRYYKKALESIPGSGDLPLVLFSDDPKLALEIIEPLHPVAHQVIPPPEVHPMETLALMALGCALVIANSSFSWWAAWLSRPNQPIIAAPADWFARRPINGHHLYLPEWNIIS